MEKTSCFCTLETWLQITYSLHSKLLAAGRLQSFYEKLLEASSMPDRVKDSQFWDGHVTDQVWAHHQQWSYHGWSSLEQSVLEGLHPMECIHAGAVHEELHHVGRNHVTVLGGLSTMGGTPHWSRERVWERRCSRRMHNELTATPIPWFPAQETENLGAKFSLGRREEEARRCFEDLVLFLITTLWFDWQQNKLISPSRNCFACDSNCWVSTFLSWPMSLLSYFPLPCAVKERQW